MTDPLERAFAADDNLAAARAALARADADWTREAVALAFPVRPGPPPPYDHRFGDDILALLDLLREAGDPEPGLRDIARHFRVSESRVANALTTLRRRGKVVSVCVGRAGPGARYVWRRTATLETT